MNFCNQILNHKRHYLVQGSICKQQQQEQQQEIIHVKHAFCMEKDMLSF